MLPIPDTLITTYLQMMSLKAFKPAFSEQPGLEIVYHDMPDLDFYRQLYRLVGERWRWRDRLLLSDDDLRTIVHAPGDDLYVLSVDGNTAGYIELERQGSTTEVAYFGLADPYIGRGLGKHLLSYGIDQAWKNGARRVWLHTCNLDGPHALGNYVKRGFTIYNIVEQPMPDRYR